MWVAVVVLFAVSPLLARGSLSSSALLSMLPVAAVLMLAGIGQTLVIQQGGLDFSVPGAISLAAVIVTHYAGQQNHRLFIGMVLTLAACALAGLLNGLLVAVARVPSIIATLGTSALLEGAASQYSSQTVVQAPGNLSRFMVDKTVGVPNTFVIGVVVVVVVTIVMRRTAFGRRYQLTGTSRPAAWIAGMAVTRLTITGYLLAGLSYGIAGIVLAGYLSTPDINAGDPYLLSTVAAVVLGGASLAGGSASVLATAAGAVFLSQLDQVVLSSGSDVWAQYLIQGGVIGVGMTLRLLPGRLLRGRLRRAGRGQHGLAPASASASVGGPSGAEMAPAKERVNSQ